MVRRENAGSPRSKAVLGNYSDVLKENDLQIERLERLMTHQTPTPSQQVMVTRLESAVKEGIAKERAMQAELENLLSLLADPTERYVIRLRYFDLVEWEDIGRALFGDRDDYISFVGNFASKTFKIHSKAIRHLDAILDAVDRGTVTT